MLQFGLRSFSLSPAFFGAHRPFPARACPGLVAAGLAALLSASLPAAAQEPAALAPGILAPHRAIYDLKLGDSSDRSGIAAVDGRIVYETSGSACDGYTSTFRLVMRVFDTKGGSQLSDLQTSAYESADGFDFTVRTFANGIATEDTLGRARHQDDTVMVDLKRPDEESITLQGKALFPVEHTRAIIAAAKAGKRILQADTFDGSESGRAIFPTLSVIGKEIDPAQREALKAGKRDADDAAAVAVIGKGRVWPVTVSFYAPNMPMEESEPVYSMSFLQYENGVTRRMRLDYGDFSVVGKLSAFEYQEPPAPCPGN